MSLTTVINIGYTTPPEAWVRLMPSWPVSPGTSGAPKVINYSDVETTADRAPTGSGYRTMHLENVLARIPTSAPFYLNFDLPGRFGYSDFTSIAQTGLYHSKCYGFWNMQGLGTVVIAMVPGSSTKGSLIPAQTTKKPNPYKALRIGSTGFETHTFGIVLEGTDQGHLYGGFTVYGFAAGSTVTDMLITGHPGNWNSPPGETHQFSPYIGAGGAGLYCENITIDGLRTSDGAMVGGSPWGNDACGAVYVKNCTARNSLVSMFGTSFSGSLAAPKPGGLIDTDGLVLINNGNHSGGDGQGSSGTNHEGVTGSITHRNLYISMDRSWVSGSSNGLNTGPHVHFGSPISDNTTMTYIEPTWPDGPAFAHGCYVVRIPRYYATYSFDCTMTATTEVVTFSRPHGYSTGDKITFDSISGGSPITTGTTYYVKTVPTTSTMTISTSKNTTTGIVGPAVDITADGSGTAPRTAINYQFTYPTIVKGGVTLLPLVKTSMGVLINDTDDTVQFPKPHGLVAGNPVVLNDLELSPIGSSAPLVSGTTYYVKTKVSDYKVTLGTTSTATTRIGIDDAGSGWVTPTDDLSSPDPTTQYIIQGT